MVAHGPRTSDTWNRAAEAKLAVAAQRGTPQDSWHTILRAQDCNKERNSLGTQQQQQKSFIKWDKFCEK